MDDLDEIPHVVTVQPIAFSIPTSEVGRELPSREVTTETIADAYVTFILFCNPSYSTQDDTLALKATFAVPPSSSGKIFETFDVYQLVKRLFEHDLRTWQQVAEELGVENLTDSTSSQKLSQFIVRLKRWMKLTHIDAFFHYLIGKPHDYFLSIPPLDDAFPSQGRDGILTTEDLALRALDPKLRPKRGRKRLETSMDELPPAQRHKLGPIATPDGHGHTFATPASALARSAVPFSAVSQQQDRDPWSSVTNPRSRDRPVASAVGPASAMSRFQPEGRGQSVSTPQSATKTFRWSNSSYSAASAAQARVEPRATPSDDRLAQDSRSQQTIHPIKTTVCTQPPMDTPMSAVSAASTSSRRERQRLQLQVPEHKGGPVRLMTPVASNANPTGLPADKHAEPQLDLTRTESDEMHRHLENTNHCRDSMASMIAKEIFTCVGNDADLNRTTCKQLAYAMLRELDLDYAMGCTIGRLVSVAVRLGVAHRCDWSRVLPPNVEFMLPPYPSVDVKVKARRIHHHDPDRPNLPQWSYTIGWTMTGNSRSSTEVSSIVVHECVPVAIDDFYTPRNERDAAVTTERAGQTSGQGRDAITARPAEFWMQAYARLVKEDEDLKRLLRRTGNKLLNAGQDLCFNH